MNRARLSSLFEDVDVGSQRPIRGQPIAAVTSQMLRDIGIEASIEDRAAAASRSMGISFANVGMGVGFASWVMYEAAQNLAPTAFEHSIDALFGHAEKWTGFLVDVLTHPETWSTAGELALHAFENAATMPIGTIQAAADIIDSLSHAGSFVENMDAIDGFAHVADAADAATTLGLSIALGYVAGKVTDAIVEDVLRPLWQRIGALQAQLTEILRVRHALSLGMPAPVIAPQLDHIASDHWAF